MVGEWGEGMKELGPFQVERGVEARVQGRACARHVFVDDGLEGQAAVCLRKLGCQVRA